MTISAVESVTATFSGKTPTFTLLYKFAGGSDGANPSTVTMVRDGQGNLYGTTHFGGDLDCNISLNPSCGVAFRLDAGANLTPIHIFEGNGASPPGAHGNGLVLDGSGNLYGTADLGNLGHGFVFQLDKNGAFTDLYDFAAGSDGDVPTGYLFRNAAGTLYGTTLGGGGSSDPLCPNGQGCGTVFELGPTGQYKVLYSFLSNADGTPPQTVIGDVTGNLYGTTFQGGQGCTQALGCGTIFKLNTSGKKTVLHAFTGGPDGSLPAGGLALDSAGNLYGSTLGGGDPTCPYTGTGPGCGVVFKIDNKGVETVLHTFHGGSDGGFPGSLILDAAGYLYGVTGAGPGGGATCGLVFKIDPSGNLTNLHTIAGGSEGCGEIGALVPDTAGNLYGASATGGDPNCGSCGTLWEIIFVAPPGR